MIKYSLIVDIVDMAVAVAVTTITITMVVVIVVVTHEIEMDQITNYKLQLG